MSSNFPSQTFAEHDELIKYECNLASCYETEYLLSLKLQEDMMNSSESSTAYDDGYEVQVGLSARAEPCSQVPASTSSLLKQDPLSQDEPMETTSSHYPYTKNNTGIPSQALFMPNSLQQQPSVSWHSHSANAQSQAHSQPPVFPVKSNHIIVDTQMQNGYSLMGDLGHGNSHSEGPSRKRIRLHQPEQL